MVKRCHCRGRATIVRRALTLLGLWLLAGPVWAAPLILWEVTGGPAPVWLFGSIHICHAHCFPLPPVVEARFSKADVLAVELDATSPANLLKMATLMQGEGDLREQLTEREWNTLVEVMAPSGMDENQLARTSAPMAGAQIVMVVAGQMKLSPAYGTDIQLITRARKANKPLVELETVERQMRAINAGTPAERLDGLRHALRVTQDGSMRRLLQEVLDAWLAGNARRLATAMRNADAAEPGSERFNKEVFTYRNQEMSERIAKLSQQGKSVFVVVGSGHLVGPGSIPSLLRKKGFRVRQLSTEDAL